MAQAFLTVYEKTYVWHDYTKRTKSEKAPETIYAEAPKADIWLPPITAGYRTFLGPPMLNTLQVTLDHIAYELDVRKRNLMLHNALTLKSKQHRFIRCQVLKEQGDDPEEEKEENELIEIGRRIYSEPTQKIMQPLPTARKVYGYLRPRNMYMGLSEYQGTIGKNGYDILLRNYEASNENA